jgi:hypothetical protein
MPNAPAQRRQRASDRSLAGAPIADSCRALACSKRGLDTWRDRSLATDPAWSAELRRRPRTAPTNTPPRLEQAVVALRHTLAHQGHDGGAASIQQALEQHGITPVPSPRTIARMLHRAAQAVTSTNHHQPSAHQLGNLRSALTDPLVKGLSPREATRQGYHGRPALDARRGDAQGNQRGHRQSEHVASPLRGGEVHLVKAGTYGGLMSGRWSC